MKAKGSDLIVGRVVHEDEKFITIEIAKSNDTPYTLDPETPDRFYTLLFVKSEDGSVRVWRPWE